MAKKLHKEAAAQASSGRPAVLLRLELTYCLEYLRESSRRQLDRRRRPPS